jgi:hypothetical protein
MNLQLFRYGLVPFLFGFLLLGAMSHAPRQRQRAPQLAAPAPAVPAPHLQRALAGSPGAAIAPLPAYVPEPDDAGCAGIRVCAWAI